MTDVFEGVEVVLLLSVSLVLSAVSLVGYVLFLCASQLAQLGSTAAE